MHLCYIDEAGSTGKDLASTQQPLFTMVGLLVSDEKWKKTEREYRAIVSKACGGAVPEGFELHACDLLAPDGQGPFTDWTREARNQLALDILELVDTRRHQLLLQVVHKRRMAAAEAPERVPLEVDWRDPWEVGFAAVLTMTEEFLRSGRTGSSSTGMVIIDHEPGYLDVVRSQARERQQTTGWRQTKKVMEIGYSAVSHANPMIQIADLVAFTIKKSAEADGRYGSSWPEPARAFYGQCRKIIWPRVEFKMLQFSRLAVPEAFTDYLKEIRSLRAA